LFILGKIDESLDAYRRAATLSDNGYPRTELVRSLATAGYWKEAEVECRKALETDPTNPLAPAHLAGLLDWHGRADDGLALSGKAVEMGANAFKTQFSFGEFLMRLERPDEAVAPYRRALALEPKNNTTQHRLARALAASGHPDEAIAEYRALIARVP